MDNNSRNKKPATRISILEALKEVGGSTFESFRDDVVVGTSKDLAKQIFGTPEKTPQFSGEIAKGERLSFEEILTGERQEKKDLEAKLSLERKLRQEEEQLKSRKGEELKLELHAIMVEVARLAKETPKLAMEVEIAAFQAPTNPGVYHLIFFEKLLEFIKSFRKQVHDARTWLHSVNKRAQKKNFWNMYKKHGAKRLFSAEDYSQRSAG